MKDCREILESGSVRYKLTIEAKAKLYDIQQEIIRAAIERDDVIIRLGTE